MQRGRAVASQESGSIPGRPQAPQPPTPRDGRVRDHPSTAAHRRTAATVSRSRRSRRSRGLRGAARCRWDRTRPHLACCSTGAARDQAQCSQDLHGSRSERLSSGSREFPLGILEAGRSTAAPARRGDCRALSGSRRNRRRRPTRSGLLGLHLRRARSSSTPRLCPRSLVV